MLDPLMALQLAGAGMVLLAFVLAQYGVLAPRSLPSLWLNTVGAGVLAVLAYHDAQWGFLALEGVWAVVAGSGLLGRLTGRTGPADRTIHQETA